MPERLREMTAPEELAATLEVALASDGDPRVRREAALTIASALTALAEELAAHPDPGADPLCFYEDADRRRHLLL
jgi:hypothetical protein